MRPSTPLAAVPLALLLSLAAAGAAEWPSGLPVYDHVVVVVEENKDYEQIFSDAGPNGDAAFLTQLAQEGALFTRMFGEEHNSEGNYFWLFAGARPPGLGFRDELPATRLRASNLGQGLIDGGRSFKAYSEDLPAIGSRMAGAPAGCLGAQCLYARKHAPWVSFDNLPQGSTADTSSNLRFADFPSDYTRLPTVSFVVPNQLHDMHSGPPDTMIRRGDDWLRDKLGPYYAWAKGHNSLLIVTFDENNDQDKMVGLTDPRAAERVLRNRVATIFAGARIKPGRYDEGNGITHVNILRTLEAMYGLPKSGRQQENALAAGIGDDFIVTDVFGP
jgi:acid phosphatase